MDAWDEGHVTHPVYWQAAQAPLPSDILPQLRAINAPYMFMSRCLQHRPIRHITLSSDFSWSAQRDFETIRTHCPQLEELVLTMNHVPLTRVLSFALSLSCLRCLRLEILNASLETTHKPVCLGSYYQMMFILLTGMHSYSISLKLLTQGDWMSHQRWPLHIAVCHIPSEDTAPLWRPREIGVDMKRTFINEYNGAMRTM